VADKEMTARDRPGSLSPITPSARAFVFAVAAAIVGTAISIKASQLHAPSDLDPLLAAARYLWAGQDPYTRVGPGMSYSWPWPLYYPLPAVILALPFTLVSATIARASFAVFSCALLGAALGRTRAYCWPILLSGAFLNAAVRTQWTPLLTAAVVLPSLGFVYAAKPNIGIALWGTRPTSKAAIGACVLLGVSLAWQPLWPIAWWHAGRLAPHLRPAVLYPWGWLLILAALKWRRPEARLLLFFALVPQTLAEYAVLPLFLVTQNVGESAVLALGTIGVAYYVHAIAPATTDAGYIAAAGRSATLLCFLPCLVMVLRRPNRGAIPAWLERSAASMRRVAAARWATW
jgi:hypothetical protein